MRHERGSGVSFDHASLKADLTLFEDHPDRIRVTRQEGFTADFHLRFEAGGSFQNLSGSRRGWGWGGRVEALSLGLGPVELHAALGGGSNYYEDIVMLPIVAATDVRLIFGGSF